MEKKTIIQKVKELFTSEEVFSVDVKTVDNRILRLSEMAVGGTVTEINADGEIAVEDGEYSLEDGNTIVVTNGTIEEIKPTENVVEKTTDSTEMSIETTLQDGTQIYIENATDGMVSVGDVVYIVKEDGTKELAPTGDHILSDGTTVTLDENSAITDIVEPQAMEEETEETEETFEVVEKDEVLEVINNLKSLIDEVKELKSQFEAIKTENQDLKERVNQFAKSPSDKPTDTKVSFGTKTKEDKLRFFSKR